MFVPDRSTDRAARQDDARKQVRADAQAQAKIEEGLRETLRTVPIHAAPKAATAAPKVGITSLNDVVDYAVGALQTALDQLHVDLTELGLEDEEAALLPDLRRMARAIGFQVRAIRTDTPLTASELSSLCDALNNYISLNVQAALDRVILSQNPWRAHTKSYLTEWRRGIERARRTAELLPSDETTAALLYGSDEDATDAALELAGIGPSADKQAEELVTGIQFLPGRQYTKGRLVGPSSASSELTARETATATEYQAAASGEDATNADAAARILANWNQLREDA